MEHFELNRYENEISSITSKPIQKNKVLLVGSSLFTLWGYERVQKLFDGEVLNHGFGGATIDEILYYYHKIVLPYEPSKIILRVGLNDIFKKAAAAQAFFLFERLVKWMHTDFPGIPITALAIHDVPALVGERSYAKEPVQEFNKLLIDFAQNTAYIKLIDISEMVYADKKYAKTFTNFKDIFREDQFHFNDAGYAEFEEYFKKEIL